MNSCRNTRQKAVKNLKYSFQVSKNDIIQIIFPKSITISKIKQMNHSVAVDMTGRQYHMHIFGIRNIQLQTLPTFVLNYVEAVGVFSNVAVKEVVIHMQEVMQKLPVCFVTIAFPGLALLQALVPIASIAHKTVDGQGVGSVHIDGLAMDENALPDYPLQRFL